MLYAKTFLLNTAVLTHDNAITKPSQCEVDREDRQLGLFAGCWILQDRDGHGRQHEENWAKINDG